MAALQQEFEKRGVEVPKGLHHIVNHAGETRHDVYRALWSSLIYVEKLKAPSRTLVYPLPIREAIRKRFPDTEVGKYDDQYEGKAILWAAGVLGSLGVLLVTSNMITKSSTAVLMSVSMLYNILRLCAAGFLATFTFVRGRLDPQKICNFMWLLGTWGANCSLLDMSVEEALTAERPDLASRLLTPIMAVKKTMMVFLLGLVLDSMAFVHAVFPGDKTLYLEGCNGRNYFYAYSPAYSMYVVGLLHFVLPSALLILATGVLVVAFVRSRAVNQRSQEHRLRLGAQVGSYKKLRIFVVFIVGFNASMGAMYGITFLRLMIGGAESQERKMNFIYNFHVAEFCQLASATVAPFFLCFWRNYRSEASKLLCRWPERRRSHSQAGTTLTVSRSVHSLTGSVL